MSKIDELINKLCPNGVCFVMLGDVFDEIKGMRGVTNKWKNEGNCRFIDYLNVYRHMSVDVLDLPFATVQKLDQDTLKKGDILFTSASETPDECALEAAIEKDVVNSIFLDDHLFGLRLNLSYRNRFITGFLKHYFRSESFRKDVLKAVRGVTRFYIAKHAFMKLTIPVPPIDVQCEIVRILDNFTELTAELTAELIARKKQYEYYKQSVFDSLSNYPIVHITDIALIKARVGWQRLTKAEYLQSGNYYLITGTDFKGGKIDFSSCVYVSKERYEMDPNIIVHKSDVLITKDGTLGKVAFLHEEPDKPTTLNSGVFRIKSDVSKVYPKYLYHYFTSKNFTDFVESVKTGSTIPHLTQEGLAALDIPLPPVKKQKEISDLLDNFEFYSSDMSQGLPAEIDCRKSQYEYYRDKLLEFKEL